MDVIPGPAFDAEEDIHDGKEYRYEETTFPKKNICRSFMNSSVMAFNLAIKVTG